MAIVNLTSDSFYDGGKYHSLEDILQDVECKIEQGADIIDIGATSSRPGAKVIAQKDEWSVLLPVLKKIRNKFPNIPLSVDTYWSETAKNSIAEGVNIINDISAGSIDNKMFSTIIKLNVPYILMHMKGLPEYMQNNPNYTNVIKDVSDFFEEKVLYFTNNNFNKIIIDPGFGFGKNIEHNFLLLKNLSHFKKFNLPILVGLSRKSMINEVLNISPNEALNGSTALNTVSLLNGANILRVHDVKEALQCSKLIQMYNSI
ncbi:MAG: dihydropteroate synthase [Bacteroidetes bacterium]|nr:dihydropteroate synthase [Bacteroidota bacterium]